MTVNVDWASYDGYWKREDSNLRRVHWDVGQGRLTPYSVLSSRLFEGERGNHLVPVCVCVLGGGREGVIHRTALYKQCGNSHQGEPASIPGRVTPGFSQVGIVPDNAAGRRVYSGICRFFLPCILELLHTHLVSPLSALKTSLFKSRRNLLTQTVRRNVIRPRLVYRHKVSGCYGGSSEQRKHVSKQACSNPDTAVVPSTCRRNLCSCEVWCTVARSWGVLTPRSHETRNYFEMFTITLAANCPDCSHFLFKANCFQKNMRTTFLSRGLIDCPEKLWRLSIFLDPQCHVCTGNIKIKVLQSTMDNAVTVQSYLIVTGRGWVELPVLTKQEHLLKPQPPSMWEASDVYLEDLCNMH
ncbi:hypothetical protein PR048_010000 [Dryococelus australis]|uniref:Uncharacterized protein n=1 Tax=Dryococelus australis TaxID=614101 RepID=A0ABQ9I1H2_9NEOP|nr:hypothetical protein PR048_010000 [Dryococelus australis]